jgi:Xaa-Pro aminopeptidase
MRKLTPKERLSQAELDRRYDSVRTRMKQRGLDLLLVSGIRFVAGTGYLRYLTNWAEPFAGELLIFPLKGVPIFLARTGERALLVKDLIGLRSSAGSTAAHAAAALKKTGCKRIGICGLKTMLAEFYVQLTAALPDVAFVDASEILDEVRMIKSEEELVWVRASANLSDIAFKQFSTLIHSGCSEADVFLEVDYAVKKRGAENTYFMMTADPHPVSKFLDLAFDIYQKGDIVLFNSEVSGPGGYYTQLERTVSIGKPTKETEAAYAVCLAAFDSATALLRPGCKARDVYHAIVKTIEGAGYKMGLHPGHSQGLDIFERPLIAPSEETELMAGMVIVIHPHVLLPSGGGVWIGETFLITDDGCQDLQKSPKALKTIEVTDDLRLADQLSRP